MSNLSEFKKPKKRTTVAAENMTDEQPKKIQSMDLQRRQYELFLERKRNGMKTRENPPTEHSANASSNDVVKKGDSKKPQFTKDNKTAPKNIERKYDSNVKSTSNQKEAGNSEFNRKSESSNKKSIEKKLELNQKNESLNKTNERSSQKNESSNQKNTLNKKNTLNQNVTEMKSDSNVKFTSSEDSRKRENENIKFDKNKPVKLNSEILSFTENNKSRNKKIKSDENALNCKKSKICIESKQDDIRESIDQIEEHTGEKNKITKREIKHTRSNPKCEYVLDDAKPDEKELIIYGTVSDRINCLSLLCARNPSAENYKQLLMFCENQRNDVKCDVLRNLRDLLKENVVDDAYIKGRILKSFEMGVRNQHIKSKVVEYIGFLIRAEVYAKEFISILVSRLIESKEQFNLVCSVLNSIFLSYEELVLENIEDFYNKNDNFKSQYHVLKFLSKQTFINERIAFDFYQQAFRMLDEEYSEDHKNLMLEYLINGIAATASRNDEIESIDRIRTYLNKPKTVVACLRLLQKISDPLLCTYIQRIVKANVLRCSVYEIDLLNSISALNNSDLFGRLVNDCFYHSVEYILSVILLAGSTGIPGSSIFGLRILMVHYHPLVRSLALKLFRGEVIGMFDPYDSVMLNAMTGVLETKK